MHIEIIAVGDEILRGSTVNTNAAFISRQLLQQGFTVARHAALPDDPGSLEQGLKEALARSQLVITTGGLGPTCDDHTRQVAAKLFDSDFYFDEKLASDLSKRYVDGLASLQDQATVPRKAKLLPNPVGTASGLIFSHAGKTLVLLPGVPQEMERMVTSELIPYLQHTFPHIAQKPHTELHLCHLYENHVDPTLRALSARYPAVAVGIYPAYGTLMVTLSSSEKDQLEQFHSALSSQFQSYIFQAASGKIEEAVHAWFTHNHKTLAFAESCTGGLMAAHVTALPGASQYFLGSVVAYANPMKQDLLGVSEKTLEQWGAVSREVVLEMLAGVFSKTQADVALAVTGIAGPSGGSLQKPVGTMWAAIGERGQEPYVGTFLAKGNRQIQILSVTNNLLAALFRTVSQGICPFPFFN